MRFEVRYINWQNQKEISSSCRLAKNVTENSIKVRLWILDNLIISPLRSQENKLRIVGGGEGKYLNFNFFL